MFRSESKSQYGGLVGATPKMLALYDVIDKVAHANTTILVTGENGTGKELVANAIHAGSARRNRPFVAHNCSSFDDNILESQLFGHAAGAFTGAYNNKKGIFEAADKGTVFLDEIGDMSPALQVKILRILQEGSFTRVGDTIPTRVDVRVIAATNRDLSLMVESGSFRKDLYYRVNVINIIMPALRERYADLEHLIAHFLTKHNGSGKYLSTECIHKMKSYPWPGNVRELENEIERLVVLGDELDLFGLEHLSGHIRNYGDDAPSSYTNSGSLPEAIQRLEKRMIRDALYQHNGNKTRAAQQLKVSRRNLIRLVKTYEL